MSDILHVATDPVTLFSMPVDHEETTGYCLDLSGLFPTSAGMWTPQLSLAPLGEGRVIMHEGIVRFFVSSCMKELEDFLY